MTVMLKQQFRMHSSICEFPSNHFYKGELTTCPTSLDQQQASLSEGEYLDPPSQNFAIFSSKLMFSLDVFLQIELSLEFWKGPKQNV